MARPRARAPSPWTAQKRFTCLVALFSVFACLTNAQNLQQSGSNAVQSAAAAGAPRAEVRGVQFLTATAVVTAPLTVRGIGAAVLDCGALPTAFIVR